MPKVKISQPQYTALVGSSIALVCDVTASPVHYSVTWQRIIGADVTTLTIDGNRLRGSSVNDPSLTITMATNNDQGYYACSAMNSVGIGRSSQTYLRVTGSTYTY